MTVLLDTFVVDIRLNNKPYTPQQVYGYYSSRNPVPYADPIALNALKEQTHARFQEIFMKHGLEMGQPLQHDTSVPGKELSELVFNYANAEVDLMTEGADKNLVLL